MFYETIRQMKKQLAQVEKWLDATVSFAETKKVDPNLFLGFRLAPDQFPLLRQVQITCDTAKLVASRLAGKDAPAQSDTEQTIPEIRARLAAGCTYLDGFTAKDFEQAATRVISQPRWEGKVMSGMNYFIEHATPNFFFHLTTTYEILRHNGVPLGKRDYLGQLTLTTP